MARPTITTPHAEHACACPACGAIALIASSVNGAAPVSAVLAQYLRAWGPCPHRQRPIQLSALFPWWLSNPRHRLRHQKRRTRKSDVYGKSVPEWIDLGGSRVLQTT